MARLVDPYGPLAHVVRLSLSFRKYISDGNLPLQVSSDQLGLLEKCYGSSASALGFACQGIDYDSCLRWDNEWETLGMNGIHGMPAVTALSKLKDRQFLRMVEIKTKNTPKLSDTLRKIMN